MTTLDLAIWNAHGNAPVSGPRVVARLADETDDHLQAAVLTEVKGCRRELKTWAKRNGFRSHQERPSRRRDDEHGDTALLIRVKGEHAIKVRRRWVAVMAEPWWVWRYRVLHQPRRQQRVVGDLPDGTGVRISGEHWATKGNTDARTESYRSALRFLERRGLAVVAGDLNSDRDLIDNLADDAGGRSGGRQPDWLIVNRPGALRTRVVQTPGSDHSLFRFRLEV